jgi:hypothetical protein
MVASRCAVITSTPTTFVDVITGVSGLVIVDDAFTDRGLALFPCGVGSG